MPLALASRFKALIVALPVAAVLAAVLYVTGKHGWAAFVAFIAALWIVLEIRDHYGLRWMGTSRQK